MAASRAPLQAPLVLTDGGAVQALAVSGVISSNGFSAAHTFPLRISSEDLAPETVISSRRFMFHLYREIPALPRSYPSVNLGGSSRVKNAWNLQSQDFGPQVV